MHKDILSINLKKINVYLFVRERKSMSRGGAGREQNTESEAGFRLWAVSTEPDAGLEPMNCKIMTWAEVRRPIDWATQVFQLKDMRVHMWNFKWKLWNSRHYDIITWLFREQNLYSVCFKICKRWVLPLHIQNVA